MKRAATIIAGAVLTALPVFASAADYCWQEAGARYGVDPLLLYAIARQESRFDNHATNRNPDGSEDVCMMQINSSHFGKLASYGITRERLVNDPCLCIEVGAWVLSSAYVHYGVDWRQGVDWDGVGAYNAGTKASSGQQRRREAYARSVQRIYLQAAEQRR